MSEPDPMCYRPEKNKKMKTTNFLYLTLFGAETSVFLVFGLALDPELMSLDLQFFRPLNLAWNYIPLALLGLQFAN